MRVPLDAALFQFQAAEWGGTNPRMHQGGLVGLARKHLKNPGNLFCLFVRLLLGLVCKIIIMNVYKGVIAAGRKLNASPPRRGDVRSRCLRKLLENPLRYSIISLSRIILSVADESLYFCSGYTSRGISACLGACPRIADFS